MLFWPLHRFLTAIVLSFTAQLVYADVFIVTNAASSGPGSFAQAMQDAYDNFGSTTNTIQFAIPGPGVHTILASPGQSPLLRNTLIDGYTQPGALPNTLTNGDNAMLLIEYRGGLTLYSGCTVRGLVINSATYAGISISSGGVVEGNFIGTDPSGTVALGNADYGVYVSSGDVRIGGSSPAARNIISASRYAGVAVYGGGTNNVIQGNLIGTDATGLRPLGNAVYGIVNISNFTPSTPVTHIGGTNSGEGNVIAYNGVGVWIQGGLRCAILGNSIFGNTSLGIDLGYVGGGAFIQPDGPTPNYPGGTNSGPNLLQNHPVLSSVQANGSTTLVQGTFNGGPNGTFRLEFFGNPGIDPSGYGQGKTFLGFKSVTTDAAGNATFSASLPGNFPFVAATATDSADNTSEFSADLVTATNHFQTGDLLVALNNGLVQWRRPDGNLVRTLDPGLGWNSPVGGMAFDRAGNLYVTGQTNVSVIRFSPAGNSLGIFSTNQYGYSSDVFFDVTSNMWVGSEFGNSQLARYDPQGHLLSGYNPAFQLAGLYHVQLGADQRTVYYSGFVNLIISTPEVGYLGRYDLMTGQPLPFVYLTSTNVNPPGVYGFKILPDGGALLSVPNEVLRVTGSRQILTHYNVPGEDSWDPVALDSDGRSFWAASSSGPFLYKFDIASGALLARIDTACSGGVSSIAVFGQPVATDASLFLGGSANENSTQTSQPFAYTLSLLNFRTNTANSVVVTDTIPAGSTFVSATSTAGTVGHNGQLVTFTLGSVPAGSNVTMTVSISFNSTGTFTNTAIVTAAGTDSNPTGHTCLISTTVLPAPSSLLVHVTADSGPGSLRDAIQSANASAGGGTISFNLPGPGPYVFQPTSPLPTVTKPVTIDGYSQQGATPNSSATNDNATLQILLDGANAGPLADGLILSGGHSTVQGLVIENFSGNGLVLSRGDSNVLSGNFIGTDPTGTAARPNVRNGILISDSLGNAIGNSGASSRNMISANGGAGIAITGDRTGGNSIQGNFIGTDRSGAAALGNGGGGVLISAPDNLVGGTNSEAGNLIAFNNRVGVEVFGIPSQSRYDIFVPENVLGVGVLGNSIYANTGLGIDLAPPGVTPNGTGGDSRDGPNELLNFPVLSPTVPGSTSVKGTLATIPDADILVQLFVSSFPDVTSYGQGQRFAGSLILRTDPNGDAEFSIPVGAGLADGQYITATATDLAGMNTSEFSRAVRVSPAADLAVSIVASASPAPARQDLTYTITVTNRGPGSASQIQLAEVLPQPVTFVSADGEGTNDFSGTHVGWLLGSLTAGASTNLHVTVNPKFIGTIATSVRVQATEFEPTPADNEVSLSTTITGSPRTLLVSNTGDNGPGSLRAALADVNANGYGLDTITFNIPGPGLHTIAPASQLPSIRVPVVIDGYTQPGAKANTLTNGNNAVLLIELRGTLPPNPNTISGVDGLEIDVGNTVVRGLIIDQFRQYGLYVYGYNSPVTNGVLIEGNFIGLISSGTMAATNGNYGIDLEWMGAATIGGASPAARNVIAGIGTFNPDSPASAIYIRDSGPVTVQGNFIGTDVTGQLPIGNKDYGINLYLGDNNTLIGGTNTGQGNLIAYTDGIGVEVGDGTNNAVLGNSIFGNGDLGLHLGYVAQGVTPPSLNHSGPGDGPNNLQNYPVITSVAGATIQGFLISSPNTVFRVEFFSNSRPHFSFHGEGQTYLGATAVTTDSKGKGTFSFLSAAPVANVTATATDPFGNTSEFSAAWLPTAGTFQVGDIFIGDAQGQIQWRRHDGTPVRLLNTGFGSSTYALAFDAAGRLVAAEGKTNVLVRFDNQGNLIGTISSNLISSPETLAFDGVGDFYVGNSSINYSSPGGQIWKLGSAGNLLDTFNIAGEYGGAGWLDLAADQHTIFYTSYGQKVKRYDVGNKTQLADFTTSLPYFQAADLRVLPDGGLLVADGQSVVRLDAAGSLVRSYSVYGEYSLATLALDPDGTSFWVSSQSNPFLYQFALGNTNLLATIPIYTQSSIEGLAILGEHRAAAISLPNLLVAEINGNADVSWGASVAGYTLQSSGSLSPANWKDVNTISNQVTLPLTNRVEFFRLIKR